MSDLPVRWTKDEESRLQDMRKAGLSFSKISAAMGRSTNAVHEKYLRMTQPPRATAPKISVRHPDRNCSTCRKKFTPAWRTNYRCATCTKSTASASPYEPGDGNCGRWK